MRRSLVKYVIPTAKYEKNQSRQSGLSAGRTSSQRHLPPQLDARHVLSSAGYAPSLRGAEIAVKSYSTTAVQTAALAFHSSSNGGGRGVGSA